MSKFSVGDRVRIRSERSVSYGDIGEVVNTLAPGFMEVVVKVNGYTATFLEHNLEKVDDQISGDNINVSVQTTKTVDIHLEGQAAAQFERLLNDLQSRPGFYVRRNHQVLISHLAERLKD